MSERIDNKSFQDQIDKLFDRFINTIDQIEESRARRSELEINHEFRKALHMVILVLAGVIAVLPKINNPEFSNLNTGLDYTAIALLISSLLLEIQRIIEKHTFNKTAEEDALALYLSNKRD